MRVPRIASSYVTKTGPKEAKRLCLGLAILLRACFEQVFLTYRAGFELEAARSYENSYKTRCGKQKSTENGRRYLSITVAGSSCLVVAGVDRRGA